MRIFCFSTTISCVIGGQAPPMGMMRSLQAVGAPLMQPYQQMQAAPPPQFPAPIAPGPQSCKDLYCR